MNRVKFPLRMNMENETVSDLHEVLTALDLKIDDTERARKRFGRSTRRAVRAFQELAGLETTGEIDAATAKVINKRAMPREDQTARARYRVRGSLRSEYDRPVGRRTVRVFEKTLGTETLLGEKTSYDNGFYDIAFPVPMGKKRPKDKFNIVVRIYDDNDEIVASSPVVFQPQPVSWINFNRAERPYFGRSAFELLSKDLRPPLEGARLQIADVSETDGNKQVTYLAKETGRSAHDVMCMIISSRLVGGSKVPPHAWFAFVGQNLPASLPGDLLDASDRFGQIDNLVGLARDGILAMDAESQRSALEKAVAENVVASVTTEEIDGILNALARLKVERVAEQPFIVGKPSLGALLATTRLTKKQRDRFVELYAGHSGAAKEFWTVVGQAAEFDAIAVADVQTTLEIGLITKNHVPFLTFLKERVGEGRPLASPRDLAKLEMADWLEMIGEAQAATGGQAIPHNLDGEDDQDLAGVYATVLMDRAEGAHPTIAVAVRASQSLRHGEQITKFVDEHPDLDLRRANVDRFVEEMDGTLAASFDEPNEAVAEIKGLQRALWLAPKPQNAAALVHAGLYSGGVIASLTQAQFLEIAAGTGFTTTEAEQTYLLAGQRYASALARFGEYNVAFDKGSPAAIIAAKSLPQGSETPTLETLFGSLDFCRCEHCESVLSPAAYFVDVLRFLSLKSGEVAGETALAVLSERRPDLGNVKLSCENTNTVMPYIDLVCEVLEEQVNATGTAFQSTLSSAELRAHPEYVNADAYEVLRGAVYPMSVPFDLWLTEARTYLEHLKVPRHELMGKLQAPAGPSETEIAAEYFGITPVAAALITTARA